MARPGLYDELVKRNLLDQARGIALSGGTDDDKADLLDQLLVKAGSSFKVTPRAVFILRHKLQNVAATAPATTPSTENKSRPSDPRESRDKTKAAPPGRRKPPPPGPNKGSFVKGDPRAAGAPPGNDYATKTGRQRNPFLRGVSEERVEMVSVQGKTLAQLLAEDIEFYRLVLMDLNTELEAIKANPRLWVYLGSTYRRQEGDGELMGTGRISERKRLRKHEAIVRLSKDIASIQAKHDRAIKQLFEIQKGTPPSDQNAGLNALARAIEMSAQLLTRKRASAGGAPAPGGEPT